MDKLGYVFIQSLWLLCGEWIIGDKNRSNEIDDDDDDGQHLLIHFLCQELVQVLYSH